MSKNMFCLLLGVLIGISILAGVRYEWPPPYFFGDTRYEYTLEGGYNDKWQRLFVMPDAENYRIVITLKKILPQKPNCETK